MLGRRSIKKYGIVMGARSEAVVVYSVGRVPPVQAIAAATISDQAYEAERTDPSNIYVQKTIENGLEATRHLHEMTPISVCLWVKDHYNNFGWGGGVNFLEFLETTRDADKQFRNYCTKNGITTRRGNAAGDSYEQVCLTWLRTNFQDKYSGYEEFENTKAVIAFLEKLGIYDWFIRIGKMHCDFLHGCLDNHVVLAVLHQICVFVKTQFGKSPRAEQVASFVKELLMYAIPVFKATFDEREDAEPGFDAYDHVEWILNKPGKDLTSTLNGLICPMSTSATVKKAIQESKNKPRKVEEYCGEPDPKRARLGGRVAHVFVPMTGIQTMTDDVPLENQTKVRPYAWIDDLFLVENDAMARLPKHIKDMPT